MILIDNDKEGNILFVDRSGNFGLQLKKEGRTRDLGFADKQTKSIVRKRQRDKHLLQKAQAYGFNYELIRHLHRERGYLTIILRDEFDEWRIPMAWILDEGEFLWFKGQGMERQIFAVLSKITKFSIRDTSRHNVKTGRRK